MSYILNSYIQAGLMNYDSIFTETDLIDGNFDEKVLKKINDYIGKTEKELYMRFSVNIKTNSKQINRIFVYKMLGINTENAEEFEKANIIVKTIRVKRNGIPKESMSFPKIKIKDFVKQDFENSLEYGFFETTRFLFVVFKENQRGEYILRGSKFWNMPIEELDTIGKAEWESYKNKFITGVNFEIRKQKNNKIILENDLPKKSDTQIFHLRPHARKSAYLINGIKHGEGNDSDMDNLPNGDKMTHQCFWLNNEYVSKIVRDLLV